IARPITLSSCKRRVLPIPPGPEITKIARSPPSLIALLSRASSSVRPRNSIIVPNPQTRPNQRSDYEAYNNGRKNGGSLDSRPQPFRQRLAFSVSVWRAGDRLRSPGPHYTKSYGLRQLQSHGGALASFVRNISKL